MKYLLIALGVTFIYIQSACAQEQSAIDLAINAIPANPQPLQEVRIDAKSFSINLDESFITWKYNNKTVASGIGRTQIVLQAPASGQTGTIVATVTGSGFAPSSATLILRPASIDLIWEAVDAYTPPFYKGKALLPDNGALRVTAISNTNTPKQLSYSWSRNGTIMQSQSGYQKTSILFKHETLNDVERIAVQANAGGFTGAATTAVTPQKPGVVAYKKMEGFIDFARGFLSTIPVPELGVVIRFEPYFFSSTKHIAQDLIFDITNNGDTLVGSPVPNELRLSRLENGGESELKVRIATAVYSLQNVVNTFIVSFQ